MNRPVTVFLILFCCAGFRGFSQEGQMYWLPDQCRNNRSILAGYLAQCPLLGLDEKDYAYDLLHAPVIMDSLDADRRITAAAIRFFRDAAYGKDAPATGYNGIDYTPSCLDIPGMLLAALAEGTLDSLLQRVEPRSPEYKAVKQQIAQLLQRPSIPGKVTSYLVDSTNRPLIEKLYQLGYLDTLNYHLPENVIREQLRKAQHLFEMYEDGGLRPAVFDALNIPVEQRIRQLAQSLNVFRWLNCYRQSKTLIVVNIPSANLFVYAGDSILLRSRTVVGRPSTPTPTLGSMVTELVMYPYWMVPYRIATRELLPAIRDNIAYLEAGNYQVLDRGGRLVDPRSINWKALGPRNFPYTIRQANGCDNSLGIMKLNFFSPYGVYLHDTPWKNYFLYNQRYFSHGCIRVDEAMPLAKLLMPGRTAEIDSLAARGGSPDGKPVTMRLPSPIPLLVLYQVAWPDEKGMIRFFNDPYKKEH